MPSQSSSAPAVPFLDQVITERQAASLLSVLAGAGTAAVATTAARLSSESARAPHWMPAAQASTRTVVVREGQSLWTIAKQWGISIETIAHANNLANAEYLKPGQRLLIPAASDPAAPKIAATPRRAAKSKPVAGRSLVVTVRAGQSLWALASANRISVDAIVEANNLSSADLVRAGQRLVIPGRAAAAQPVRRMTVRVSPPAQVFSKAASVTAVRIARGFIWPARGRLTSRFGWRRWRHHDGIDIAAPYGSPIYAARPGRVVFSGWYYAYGRAVIVDHGDGVQTLYGHASVLLVNTGANVQRGQLIAKVGTSGRSTGPHVHFEVRVNGRAVNPIKYMD